ncbi:hypothetical protein ACE102_33740 [Bradyrhizobium sp. vgs-9]|uniref:hypothetical protein n=1 Tax=Bradyrhizobium sp. vgs-9 TaxID=208389 RepID=UPI0035D48FD1
MAKLIWLGEPDENGDGPRVNHWNGIAFPRGEEVEIDNAHMIAKARKNPHYSVDGEVYVPAGAQPHPNATGPVIPPKVELTEMNVAELRAEAARRGIDVEDLSKTEIREKLMADDASK